MDWAGNVNRQVHNTVLLQDFNVQESSKLQFRDMTEANRLLEQVKKKKVDKPYESSVFLLRTVLR